MGPETLVLVPTALEQSLVFIFPFYCCYYLTIIILLLSWGSQAGLRLKSRTAASAT